jgi:diamine N-acetyltransferase
VRRATRSDVELLADMMADNYAESGYHMDVHRARAAFEAVVADERLGCAWVLESGQQSAGYMVVTLGYSMEYGGLDAFVDDLFVRRPFRGRGLGTGALTLARDFCVKRGVRALHLEVERENPVAQSLYRRSGFEDNDRQLLTLRLEGTEPA